MSVSSFQSLIQRFFTDRLLKQQGASQYTVAAYRDSFRLLLQFGLEVEQRADTPLGVLVDPAVVQEPDRDRVQEVELLPARAAVDDEACLLEHAQVLHDPEARHLEPALEVGERAAVALEEPVEQVPPRRVGERLEHPVVVHAPDLM